MSDFRQCQPSRRSDLTFLIGNAEKSLNAQYSCYATTHWLRERLQITNMEENAVRSVSEICHCWSTGAAACPQNCFSGPWLARNRGPFGFPRRRAHRYASYDVWRHFLNHLQPCCLFLCQSESQVTHTERDSLSELTQASMKTGGNRQIREAIWQLNTGNENVMNNHIQEKIL